MRAIAEHGNIAGVFEQHLGLPERVLYRQFQSGSWRDVSVAEMAELATRWQALFRARGLVPGDRIALCLKNSIWWVSADLAALAHGLVVVPLYVDDNAENAAWCIADAAASLVVAETRRIAEGLVKAGVCVDAVIVLRETPAGEVGASLPSASSGFALACNDAASLATICYTSGTSGRPKGVMLTHRNILANVAACEATGMAHADDTFLSVLPLSHMFERTGGYYLPLAIGARVAYARSVASLADDFLSQAPTVMFAVPRIFEKFLLRIEESLAKTPFKRYLFHQCVQRGYRLALGAGGKLDTILAPTLRQVIASPILTRFGGRLRLAVVGGARLDPLIARTFIGLGLPILQGYGMTEASPVVCVNRVEDNVPDSVGPPVRGVELRLGVNDELLVRAASVMRGYWNRPDATKDAIDAEGWLHTGDLAEIHAGKVFIRGRAKDVLVLSNGEKLPPQDVELAIQHDPAFEQVMLIGEGKPFLTLIAVTQEIDEKAAVQRANANLKDFPRYVRVRRAITTRDPWTIENGLLTPTLKLKRARVAEHFAKEIASVYA